MIKVVFGPPGTGKTTYVYKEILSNMSDEDIEGVLALSFTVSAKLSLLEKEQRLKNKQVRTLHSIAFSKLGLSRDNLLGQEDILRFMRIKNIPYRPEGHVTDDLLGYDIPKGNLYLKYFSRLLHESPMLGREKKVEVAKFIKKHHKEILTFSSFKNFFNFVSDFIDFQFKNNKFSFTMLLWIAYVESIELSGSSLILDEAQDLSPLMEEILVRNFDNFRDIYILGDDDQNIYQELNSAVSFLLLNSENNDKIILEKTWRLPRKVWKLSTTLIEKNKNRVKKRFYPATDREGEVRVIYDITAPVSEAVEKDESVLILCRHRKDVKKVSIILDSMNINYSVLGKEESIPDKLLSALMFVKRLKEGEDKEIITSVMAKRFMEVVEPGVLKYVSKEVEDLSNRIMDLTRQEICVMYPTLFKIINKLSPELLINSSIYPRSFVAKWWRKIHLNWNNNLIRIGTIHQSKGLEADCVIINLKVNMVTYQHVGVSEYERRVWYVGITRARKKLFLWIPGKGLLNEEVLQLAESTR